MHFQKSKTASLRSTNNCVICTSVSSKEHAENKTILESQKQYCEEFFTKKGLVIKQFFGGTYETAQRDERKAFVRMMEHVKKDKQIEYIVAYSYDRFSRNGADAGYLTNELIKVGIRLIAVSRELIHRPLPVNYKRISFYCSVNLTMI
ncbi:MAG: recombinase family protein [Pelobium sp.]